MIIRSQDILDNYFALLNLDTDFNNIEYIEILKEAYLENSLCHEKRKLNIGDIISIQLLNNTEIEVKINGIIVHSFDYIKYDVLCITWLDIYLHKNYSTINFSIHLSNFGIYEYITEQMNRKNKLDDLLNNK